MRLRTHKHARVLACTGWGTLACGRPANVAHAIQEVFRKGLSNLRGEERFVVELLLHPAHQIIHISPAKGESKRGSRGQIDGARHSMVRGRATAASDDSGCTSSGGGKERGKEWRQGAAVRSGGRMWRRRDGGDDASRQMRRRWIFRRRRLGGGGKAAAAPSAWSAWVAGALEASPFRFD